MGLNQSSAGSAKNSALINLHLATGKIGRAGCGPFSLTGQPNAMGGRETGSLANLLPGHREAADPGHRAEVAHYWGVEQLPTSPVSAPSSCSMRSTTAGSRRSGSPVPTRAIAAGPAQDPRGPCPLSLRGGPGSLRRHGNLPIRRPFASSRILGRKGRLRDQFGTADQSCPSGRSAPGEARQDWNIVCDFARRLEGHLRPAKPGLFAFADSRSLFDEYKLLTAGRDLDLSGLSYALLDRLGPQQWPFPTGAEQGTARLYADGRFPTASGRAQLVAEPYRAAQEKRDARYPLTLNTGRLRDQWHGMSRTGTCARLFGHEEEALVHLHPEELRRRQLQDGQLVRLKSRRGALILPVSADDSVRPGQAFLPMHWGDRFLKGLGCNVLTLPAFDPLSKQPELKHAGVQVESVELPWRLFALVETDIQARFEALRALCEVFDHASFSLAGRERPALLVSAAHHEAPGADLLERIDRQLELLDGPILAYDDPRRAIGKRVRLEDGRIVAVRLAGETLARDWLKELWLTGRADSELRRWLLAPLGAAPGRPSQGAGGKTLCSCQNVSQQTVLGGIARGLDLDGLKREFGCGTGCGSCVPEIKRLLAAPGPWRRMPEENDDER